MFLLFFPSSNSSKSDPALDARLLAGLVQDVWDKFYELKLSLLSQQRHETEALWMVQLDQWMDRLAELGKILVSFTQNRMLPITIS